MAWQLTGPVHLAHPMDEPSQGSGAASGVSIRLELQPSAPEPSDSSPEKPTTEPNPSRLTAGQNATAKQVAAKETAAKDQAATKVAAKDSPAKVVAPRAVAPKAITAHAEDEKLGAEDGGISQSVNPMRPTKLAASSAHIADQPTDRDFSNERLESDIAAQTQVQPDDVPLEQGEHPFDAPAAKSTAQPTPAEPSRSSAPQASRGEPFTHRELQIQAGIRACLSYYQAHPENTTRRGPWALMHAALPLGVECEVLAGNRRVNALGWLCFNGTCGKQNMFQPTRQGFRPNVGPGVQGHEGQFLAILAQSKVPADYPLQINRRKYTVMDLARYEMATCREKSELTFKLIGLSHYLEPNQQWRDNRGQRWNLEKMVAEELAQPINGAACGGVHRLMGLSYSLLQRQEAGQPITGHWERSKIYLNDYVNYTMSLQNPDGSFSTNWLESRGMDPNVERQVQTTGHILEWLVYTLPDDHVRSPRIESAVEFLLGTVGREPQRDWPIGPRGHALRALALYSQRVFGARPGNFKAYLAGTDSPAAVR